MGTKKTIISFSLTTAALLIGGVFLYQIFIIVSAKPSFFVSPQVSAAAGERLPDISPDNDRSTPPSDTETEPIELASSEPAEISEDQQPVAGKRIRYVNPQGNDSNDGFSVNKPFKTIQKAVDLTQPGDTIQLADGVYLQDFVSRRAGEKTAPIVITGSSKAVVKGGGNSRVIEINHDHITLDSFTVDGLFGDSKKAGGYRDKLIYVLGKAKKDGVQGLRIQNMTIQNAGGECIRLRYFAQNNEIAHNTITRCGVVDFSFDGGGKNGEGIYIGTAPEQCGDGKNPSKETDLSNNNWIHDNIINTQGNECVDIKEGSTGNVVEKNKCTGQRDPESGGMDSRGSGNTFRSNEIYGNRGAGIRLGGDKSTDGVDNNVYANVIRDNKAGGIKLQQKPQAKICGNQFSNNNGGNYVGSFAEKITTASQCN